MIKIEKVDKNSEGQRLDIYLANVLSDYSRSQIKKAIINDCVLKDNEIITDPNYRIQVEDTFTFTPLPIVGTSIYPEEIFLDIVYEDKNVLVINKPFGMVMHPAAGNWKGTIANAVLGYLKRDESDATLRAGIVHRLDKDTSGLVIVAKDNKTLEFLQSQFREKTVVKKYYAIVIGKPKYNKGLIDAPIGRHRVHRKKFTITEQGKKSVTNYKVLKYYNKVNISLLEITPETGRTHQIRVHLSHLGHPVLGDGLYGIDGGKTAKKLNIHRQMLHAYYLQIKLPNLEKKVFEIQMAEDMEKIILNFAV